MARDKSRGEPGLERGAAKMKETSIVSVLAGLGATMSHQTSLSVPWHSVDVESSRHLLPQDISTIEGFVDGGWGKTV